MSQDKDGDGFVVPTKAGEVIPDVLLDQNDNDKTIGSKIAANKDNNTNTDETGLETTSGYAIYNDKGEPVYADNTTELAKYLNGLGAETIKNLKQQTIDKRSLKVEEINEALTKLGDEYTKLEARVKEIDAVNTEIHELNSKISDNFRDIKFNNDYIANLRSEIEELEKEHASDTSNLDELRELKKDLQEGKRKDVNGKSGQIKAMGLDLKRADTPKYVQDFLMEVLERVLDGAGREEVVEMVKKFKNQLREQPS